MQIKIVIRCHISPIKSAMIFKHIHSQAQSWSVCTEAGTYRKEWCNPPGKQSSLISRTLKKRTFKMHITPDPGILYPGTYLY